MNPNDTQDNYIAEDDHAADSGSSSWNDALSGSEDTMDHSDSDNPPLDEPSDSELTEAPPDRQTPFPANTGQEKDIDQEASRSEPSEEPDQITTPMVIEAILFAAD